MSKISTCIVCFQLLIIPAFFLNVHGFDFARNKEHTTVSLKTTPPDIFDSLHLARYGLGRVTFDYAMIGYNNMLKKGLLTNDRLLTIIDFSMSSSKKRLFVLDLKKYQLLFNTLVAHGRNSGMSEALYFSNAPESFKSSVGFYLTLGTYTGAHGYSLKLRGYESGFNDKAEERGIVMHSADYVSEVLVKQQGFIGRSLGCPALAPEVYTQVIGKIKNGSCLFMYGNDGEYIGDSKMLKQKVSLHTGRP